MDRVPHEGREALKDGGLGDAEARGLFVQLGAVHGLVEGFDLCGGQGGAVGDSGGDSLDTGMAVVGLGRGGGCEGEDEEECQGGENGPGGSHLGNRLNGG